MFEAVDLLRTIMWMFVWLLAIFLQIGASAIIYIYRLAKDTESPLFENFKAGIVYQGAAWCYTFAYYHYIDTAPYISKAMIYFGLAIISTLLYLRLERSGIYAEYRKVKPNPNWWLRGSAFFQNVSTGLLFISLYIILSH